MNLFRVYISVKKHFLTVLIVLLSSYFGSLKIYAQTISILDGFTGTAQSNQVQLRWTISTGETCNGTIIERSKDALNWEQIGDIPGICGSSSTAVSFNYIDSLPISNAINYYRLELGSRGYSEIIGVAFYNFEESSVVVIPNPVTTSATIYFEAKVFEAYTFALYDLFGKVHTALQGEGNNIVLNVENLKTGTYFFIISRPRKPIISGKIAKI